MPKKTHCLRNHDISVVGRRSNGQCRQCFRESERYENMPAERIELAKSRKFRYDEVRYSDPVKKLIKRTRERISKRRKLSGYWL